MYYWCNFFQPEKLLKVIQLLYKTPRKCRATAIDWSKNLCGNNIFCLRHLCFHSKWRAVWPDLPIYWTLGNFSKPLATISLPKSPTFLDNFAMMSKSLIFLVKSFLVNFYRHLATFYWSHCLSLSFHLSVTYTYYLSLSFSVQKLTSFTKFIFVSSPKKLILRHEFAWCSFCPFLYLSCVDSFFHRFLFVQFLLSDGTDDRT